MSLFTSPVVRATDANNLALSGAKWYFYVSGGLTPAAVYADSARTTPFASPVVADSGGLFAPIYLNPSVTYRAILKDALGSTIQDIDPIGGDRPTTVSVRDCGAIGDGTVDDTAAIQAAIDAVGASGGGEVLLPRGTYKITFGLQMDVDGVSLVGANKSTSFIQQANDSQPVIDVTGDLCEIRSLTVGYSVTATSASTAAIIANGQYCRYQSVRVSSCYNGFKFTISPFQDASDLEVFNYVNAGFYVTAVNDIAISQFVLDAGNATNGAAGGIWLQDRCEAIIMTDGEILNGVYSMTTDATLNTYSNRPAYSNFTNIYFDSSTQGVVINNMVETGFTRCWFSNGRVAPGYSGCTVQQVDTVAFTNCEFFDCGAHGCNVTSTSAKRVSFTNCSFESNSRTAGSGVSNGLNIAAGVTDFSVIGGSAHNGLYTGTQGYGINIATGASDNYSIIGVNVNSNATGGINDGGSGTTKHIIANPGCRTRNRGTGTVATGTSSVSVAHGLAFTPTTSDVLISPTSSMTAGGVSSLWCSAVSSTNITVSTNTNATANVTFTWDARKSA
jgi:hypothetical protein